MQLAGWIITGLFVLFILAASVAPKFLGLSAAVDSMTTIGWSPSYLLPLGVLEFVLAILYAIPRSSLVGAILMTGLLGGVMAAHIRVESPLWSHILFSVYLGAFLWAGLWLRDAKFRAYFKSQVRP
jgi:hypothetical protein